MFRKPAVFPSSGKEAHNLVGFLERAVPSPLGSTVVSVVPGQRIAGSKASFRLCVSLREVGNRAGLRNVCFFFF